MDESTDVLLISILAIPFVIATQMWVKSEKIVDGTKRVKKSSKRPVKRCLLSCSKGLPLLAAWLSLLRPLAVFSDM